MTERVIDLSAMERLTTNGLIQNAMTTRSEWIKSLIDPRRNYDDECGYPTTSNISADEYQELYDREAVATRVVEVLPMETWKVLPEIYEDEDPESSTPFEEEFEALGQQLLSDDADAAPSFYKGDKVNPIWEYLRRADVLSGIGHFGVILLGFNDGKDAREEVVKSENNKLLFMRCFPEKLIDVVRYESDQASPRYGKPVEYMITLNDPSESHAGMGMPNQTLRVHYSRVIHIADTILSSEIFGVPRMRPVFNRLADLRKLYGGSAEMYWRGAFPGLSIETHPQLGGDVTIDAEAITTAMENYQNGLQRYFALMGMTAKSLAPQVVDPTPQIRAQLEAICIRLGIPLRVFLGSERGELASSQDKDTWNTRLMDRQTNYVSPRIIIPFIDKMIHLGVLPEPSGEMGYSIRWPSLDSLTPLEEATVAFQITDALAKYVAGGVDTMIEPHNYMTRVLGFTDDEAAEILKATEEHVMELEEEEQRKIEEGLVPDPMAIAGAELEMMGAQTQAISQGGPPPPGGAPKKKGPPIKGKPGKGATAKKGAPPAKGAKKGGPPPGVKKKKAVKKPS